MGLWLGIEHYMLNSNMSIALVCMVKDDSAHADGVITKAVVLENAINISMNLTTSAPANATIRNEVEEAKDSCQNSERTTLSRSQVQFWMKEPFTHLKPPKTI